MTSQTVESVSVGLITGFVRSLRKAGLKLSASEQLDALGAVESVGLQSPSRLRSALRATLVKKSAHLDTFDEIFSQYFATHIFSETVSADKDTVDSGNQLTTEPSSLDDLVSEALTNPDAQTISNAANAAVNTHAGIDVNRKVGSSYYFHRTLQKLKLAESIDRLVEDSPALSSEQLKKSSKELEAKIAAEIRRRLLVVQGTQTFSDSKGGVAEEVSFLYATSADLVEMRRLMAPLARKLATRLGRRRKAQARQKLDVRSTIHASLRTGGVPMDLVYKPRQINKPELVVLADLSGSVASFARFTLNLLHVLSGQFSNLRSFAFVDEIDEVTNALAGASFDSAIAEIAATANILGDDGHSNYGKAFAMFNHNYLSTIKSSTIVLVLGDARNNYHPALASELAAISEKAKQVYWLNPEPRNYWNTGDSVMELYQTHITEPIEVRNISQLSHFIDYKL